LPREKTKPLPCANWPEQRGIDLSQSFAYSDSETDIPMLEAVGHAYAVNPDRMLNPNWPTTGNGRF